MTSKPLLTKEQIPGFDVVIFSSDRSFIDHHRSVMLSVGLVPITANTLEAALIILQLMHIALVVIDERCEALETEGLIAQAKDSGRHVPVLIVRQDSDAKLAGQALTLGATDYLDHPMFPDDVVRILLAHCASGGNSLWGLQQN